MSGRRGRRGKLALHVVEAEAVEALIEPEECRVVPVVVLVTCKARADADGPDGFSTSI